MSITSILIVVVLLLGLSFILAIAFGRAVPIENEAENRKILRSLRGSSKAQIKRVMRRLSCWSAPPWEQKKHSKARVA